MRIELYSKRRCPLCDEAHAALARARERFAFELEVRYVEDSPDAFERFRYDVPVVFADGERVFTHRVDEARLLELLEKGGMGVAQIRRTDA